MWINWYIWLIVCISIFVMMCFIPLCIRKYSWQNGRFVPRATVTSVATANVNVNVQHPPPMMASMAPGQPPGYSPYGGQGYNPPPYPGAYGQQGAYPAPAGVYPPPPTYGQQAGFAPVDPAYPPSGGF